MCVSQKVRTLSQLLDPFLPLNQTPFNSQKIAAFWKTLSELCRDSKWKEGEALLLFFWQMPSALFCLYLGLCEKCRITIWDLFFCIWEVGPHFRGWQTTSGHLWPFFQFAHNEGTHKGRFDIFKINIKMIHFYGVMYGLKYVKFTLIYNFQIWYNTRSGILLVTSWS